MIKKNLTVAVKKTDAMYTSGRTKIASRTHSSNSTSLSAVGSTLEHIVSLCQVFEEL